MISQQFTTRRNRSWQKSEVATMLSGIHGKSNSRRVWNVDYAWIFRRPWIVALFTNPRHGWSCAGVLINQNTILTAAHCVANTGIKEIKAVVGVHTILGKLNPLNYYTISAIHRHPKYEKCCKNDLAILKLTKPVMYGPRINAVCLPFHPYATISTGRGELVNRTGVIIGWGDSSHNTLTNMIKSFTLQQGLLLFDSK